MNNLKKGIAYFALFASKINEASKKVIWSQVQSKQNYKVHYTAFPKTIIAVSRRILDVTDVCTLPHAPICGHYSN